MTLLDAVRRMDRDALAEIFDLYSPALYAYVLRLCNDTMMADHIVGDVFAKLLEHLSAGNGPATNLRAYLYQTAYHIIIDEIRYWHGRVSLELVDFLRHDGHSAFLSLENRILFGTVVKAIQNNLTDYQRHVIILRFLEGFSLCETATILGKSVNIIKAVQNRAIVALREAVGYQAVETAAILSGEGNYQDPLAF